MTRKLSQADKKLMASAWAEVARAPRTFTGRSDSTRSAVFVSHCSGVCARCGRVIAVGDDCRYHDDYSGPVHDGCRGPAVSVRTVGGVARLPGSRAASRRQPRVTGASAARRLEVCPDCHLEHAGECL